MTVTCYWHTCPREGGPQAEKSSGSRLCLGSGMDANAQVYGFVKTA